MNDHYEYVIHMKEFMELYFRYMPGKLTFISCKVRVSNALCLFLINIVAFEECLLQSMLALHETLHHLVHGDEIAISAQHERSVASKRSHRIENWKVNASKVSC